MGSEKSKTEVGVSIGIQSTINELMNKNHDFLDEEYRCIKIKKIEPGSNELKTLRNIRKKFSDIILTVDANSSYTLSDMNL